MLTRGEVEDRLSVGETFIPSGLPSQVLVRSFSEE